MAQFQEQNHVDRLRGGVGKASYMTIHSLTRPFNFNQELSKLVEGKLSAQKKTRKRWRNKGENDRNTLFSWAVEFQR